MSLPPLSKVIMALPSVHRCQTMIPKGSRVTDRAKQGEAMVTRRDVLIGGSLAAGSAVAGRAEARTGLAGALRRDAAAKRARAITMWDFSWIERRWPGAGYEDWGLALDELKARGYDAVRIDAFPHLLHFGPETDWLLKPVWNQQVWGSADLNRVRILPALLEFIGECAARDIKVGLSSWYREDEANTRMLIDSPERMGEIWLTTLGVIEQAGLLDAILWTDLCNEFPGNIWAPFLQPEAEWGRWDTPHALDFMERSLAVVRAAYPDMALLYSFDNDRVETYLDHELADFDLFEHHVWMAQQNGAEYYKEVGYQYGRFDPQGYTNLILNGETAYRARPEYWQGLLTSKIDRLAEVSRQRAMPLAITECWGVVDYKDWPLLNWDWVKELCALGARRAAASGRWMVTATSNFCGPQFVGMWRDVDWHLELTETIKSAPLGEDLKTGRLWARI